MNHVLQVSIANAGKDNSEPAINSMLINPFGMVADHTGNLYVADLIQNRVCKVSIISSVTTNTDK